MAQLGGGGGGGGDGMEGVVRRHAPQTWTKELQRHQPLNVVFTGVFVWGGVAIL
jgi:hypothetical protein